MRPLVAFAAVVLALASPAFAQEPPPEEQMPPVEVAPAPPYPPPVYAPLPYPQPYEQPAPYQPPPYAPPVVVQPPPMVVQPPPFIMQPPPGCVVIAESPCAPLRPRARRKFMFKLSLGFDALWALGESLNAAATELQLGGEKNGFGGAARLQVHAGRTEHGLSFQWVELGPAFEWTLSQRWRLGFGITNGAIVIQRSARAPGPDMTAATWGAYVETTVDLVKARESSSALYASGRVGWDHLFDVTDLPSESVQGAIAVGYRY